ncbi:amino acid adenylation domain-containing protein [Streptomyces sp. NPDC057743]|uniref:non-ribosomal peptide synthetase n=1 Tax=Streptomyces sp. NPDC057743 TaxID=3346236 RepID=UPI003678EFBB
MTDTGLLPSLLAELAQLGIKLRVVEDRQLEVSAPKGRISAELRTRLARHKAELIDELLRTAATETTPVELPTLTPDAAGAREPFPLSDLQTSFLMGSQDGIEYPVRPHQYMEVEFNSLDPARFEAALNRSLARQRDNLVVLTEDVQLQAVREFVPVEVKVHDLRARSGPEIDEAIAGIREAMQRRELPLDRWPWFEAEISLHPGGGARFHYNNNNFFSDGIGSNKFLESVLHHYHHPDEPLPELELSFRDCVRALAELEESPLGEASRKYWMDRIADWPDAPAVPLAVGADSRQRSRLSRRETVFPADLWQALQQRAERRGLTPSNVLYAAYAEVLAQWGGSRHFLLNNMVTHRMPLHPQIGEVVGNFASLYPLEVDWRADEPFAERARRLQGQVMSDMEHTYWSGVKVLQGLNQVRGTPGRAPCPFVVTSGLYMGRMDRPVFSTLETPQVVLDCQFWEQHDGSLWVAWDLIESMFPDGLITAMHAGFRAVLEALAEQDAAWERSALVGLPDEQRRRREALNSPVGATSARLLHDALAERAADRADQPAVVSAEGALSYAEVHAEAERLAGRVRAAGAEPHTLVAVVMPKGSGQIVAVAGIMATGAAYVPLDPGWPDDRLRQLLQDAGAGVVLTVRAERDRLRGLTEARVLVVDEPAVEEPAAPPAAPRTSDDLAYVIYTSGSTGRPKGAMLNHRGPLNTIGEINRRFGIGPDDVLLGVSSLCFDLSVYDVFGAFDAGATLVLPDPATTQDPAAWIELIRAHGVTVWNSVPALMQLLAEEAQSTGVRLPSLRTVLLSGDWIPVDLPGRIRDIAPHATVVSLGGATEASIWSICHPIDHVDPQWPSIPYGRPLANQTWHVLDANGNDAPDWVAGDLYIGGAGLALGYWNDPEKTAAAFLSHPVTGERLYRTGDRGRYLPGGDIEFLGRADFQVKIQGFRVEPGEIEHALAAHPDVRRASVVVRDSASGKQLVAFAVALDDRPAPDAEELRAFLAERLPSYLLPASVTVLDRLPLTANGKVDSRALAVLGSAAPDRKRPYTAPRTPLESALVDIWRTVLGVERVGVHDDFFALGGQSFAALRVIAKIAQRFGQRLPLSALLRGGTVADLAERLREPADDWTPLVTLKEEGEGTPVVFVHPSGGQVLCYRLLADQLPRPSYALQAPDPALGGQLPASVEEFAERYVQALLDARPHGPYVLAGWSSGAVLAFEAARQLEARGETVAHVVVLDSPAPTREHNGAIDETALLLWFIEDTGIGFDPSAIGAQDAARLARMPEAERLDAALDLAREQGVPADGLDAAQLADAFAVFRSVVLACNAYEPPVIAADLTVLRARDGRVSEFADHPRGRDTDWGWAAHTRGTVRATTLPGTHHTLLMEPQVAAVAVEFGRLPAGDRSAR